MPSGPMSGGNYRSFEAGTIKYFIPEAVRRVLCLFNGEFSRSLTCADEYNIVRFATRRFYLWINGNLCEAVPVKEDGALCFLFCSKFFHFTTYCVLTRVKIGSPKYGGTFSSISEWVFMKFRVASGSARESLWQEPGRGSGICIGKKRMRRVNKLL